MALHANINRDQAQRKIPFNATDFMYFDVPEPEVPVQSAEVLSKRIASELFKM